MDLRTWGEIKKSIMKHMKLWRMTNTWVCQKYRMHCRNQGETRQRPGYTYRPLWSMEIYWRLNLNQFVITCIIHNYIFFKNGLKHLFYVYLEQQGFSTLVWLTFGAGSFLAGGALLYSRRGLAAFLASTCYVPGSFIHLLNHHNQKHLQTLPNVPWGQDHSQLRSLSGLLRRAVTSVIYLL